jgi:hypothetical protein
MWTWLKKLLRPAAPAGSRYVDDTPEYKTYMQMSKACPSCGLKPPMWVRGPSGTGCTNVFCGRCGEGWNVTPMIEIADKIQQDDNYKLPQYRN